MRLDFTCGRLTRFLRPYFPGSQTFWPVSMRLCRDLNSAFPRALPLSILKVRLTRGQCLALMSVGVTSAVDLDSLSAERLIECLGKVTAPLMRPNLGAD